MFEIGNSLREARLRQGIDFPEAEQGTKIRGRYLRALEDEQFDLLPAETYVRGFLRTYAEFLGLDGQLYVDEYNSRYVTGDEEPPLRPRRSSARPRHHRRVESSAILLAIGAIALVTALVFAAWRFGGNGHEAAIPNLAKTKTVAKHTVARHKRHHVRRHRKTVTAAHLILTAASGNCWLEVHAGSASGPLLYQGTLEQGQTQRFVKRRLWINVGAPENLAVRLNGKARRLRARGYPEVVIVTARGITPAKPTA